MSFLIADEDKTFIYALGPGGTNTFFCQVQSAGHERISKKEKEAVAALMADAPDLLETLEKAYKALDAIADEMTVGDRFTNAGQWLLDALLPARALIEKHRGGV